MLSVFPEILFLSPFAAFLLRIAAAFTLFAMAAYYYKNREEIGRMQFIIIGSGVWIPIVSASASAIIGVGLFVGMYTQVMALLAGLGAIKGLVWKSRYARAFPFERSTYALLLVISVCILILGAGPFAFDLPL